MSFRFLTWLCLSILTLSQVRAGFNRETSSYDLAGRAIKLLSGNGQFSENVYNALGHLKERTLYSDSTRSTKLAVFHWNHDNLGNVIYQGENWPTESSRGSGWRRTEMTYDAGNRLKQEKITEAPVGGSTPAARITNYTYDHAHNRTAKEESGAGQPAKNVSYSYNSANQLTSWNEQGVLTRTATLSYDGNGNRVSQSISSTGNSQNTTYQWDGLNRLIEVDVPDGATHKYGYDYRTRRITTQEGSATTAIVFSGGLSLAEYSVSSPGSSVGGSATVQYQRGPDMGGGVGGLLYSLRGSEAKFNLSNGRGDIVAQSNASGLVTWTASYEADGKRPVETGTNLDKQRGNSKDEDPTGLLNEGFRYRDLNTGVWLSRDPAGFVDGPNMYAYVAQNPWTAFDPLGLYFLEMDERTTEIVTNVRQADKRLEQIVMELAESPYPFEIRASMGDGETYGHKGEFSPGRLNKSGTGITDERLFKSDDRYNGKGMGGRILTTSTNTKEGKTPEETMAHELGHAFDANRGISPTVSKEKRGIVGSAKLPLSKLADVDGNENRAVRTENIYNEAKGNKIRDKYPVSRDNDRSKEEVPNPQGKFAPVAPNDWKMLHT